jgi:hypothetical protein
MKMRLITIPVSDVDRAKSFYDGNSWQLQAPGR